MKLYGYYRSSAAYRVRIALNLKGVEAEQVPVHLTRGGGEQHEAEFRGVNPQGLVPALALDDGAVLTQSLAVIEYLEERYPEPPLLPRGHVERARVRALAQMIACEIHPLNNTRVLAYLRGELGQDEAAVKRWYAHWITLGFTAIEQVIGDDGHCHGGRVSLADVFLIPQVFNARRFEVDLAPFPKIAKVEAVCGSLPAFAMAHPSRQPDAE